MRIYMTPEPQVISVPCESAAVKKKKKKHSFLLLKPLLFHSAVAQMAE